MAGWSRHSGAAIALPLENIDTDQLIPARFMSTPRREGYGRFLLHDLRQNDQGAPDTDFPLNRHPGASVLIARRNFGCGSSREAAVYALVDAGFRAVIAPGFGDIFAGNAINNGLLPARISDSEVERLIATLGHSSAPSTIDLETDEITVADQRLKLTLAPTTRAKLMRGWDDIDLTRNDAEQIAAFRKQRASRAPWSWPARPD